MSETLKRCEGCRFWGRNAPKGGRCQMNRTIPGAVSDYLTHPGILGWDDPATRPLQTSADFGCVLWEARR